MKRISNCTYTVPDCATSNPLVDLEIPTTVRYLATFYSFTFFPLVEVELTEYY